MGLSKKRRVSIPRGVMPTLSRKSTRCLSPHEERFPVGKRVNFQTDCSGAIKTSERYIEVLRADLDKSELWYSRAEREETVEECKTQVGVFLHERLEEKSNYLSVFCICCQSPCQESSDFLETAQLHVPAAARGIERGWSSSKETRKRDHVRAIVALQRQTQGLQQDMRDRVLSSRSQKSSRAERVMARLLGECDARNEKSND